MNNKAVVVGYGIISALGKNAAENLAALKNQQAGISKSTFLDTIHDFPVGEIKLSNKELAEIGQCAATLPRTALLSIIAAKEALASAGINLENLRVGLLSANTVGGMDLTETIYSNIANRGHFNMAKIQHHECGAITELTAQALGLKGWRTTISTACSSSANTIMLGAQLLEANRFDVVIAGGADALSKFTLNGFNSLMILDKEPCKPFDQNRKGLNLGEGAAYLVMMQPEGAEKCQATPYATISGYANANDAHHQTASSPEGLGNQLAMRLALEKAGLQASDIDYINLHGTGTENNDSSEGKAISAVFGENAVPAASSTKSYTGHTLGAAGAVEAVFSILAIRERQTWPHLRMRQQIEDLNWSPSTKPVPKRIKHVLSNSFGFGGNCSALVLSEITS